MTDTYELNKTEEQYREDITALIKKRFAEHEKTLIEYETDSLAKFYDCFYEIVELVGRFKNQVDGAIEIYYYDPLAPNKVKKGYYACCNHVELLFVLGQQNLKSAVEYKINNCLVK